jgi:hypothetical protein
MAYTLTELQNKKNKCGIIMPIAATEGYQQGHWEDVLTILKDSMSSTNFKPELVSQDQAIGSIHNRILKNIRDDQMVVCDISSLNPNVMIELGLRLASNKPLVITKDEKTVCPFDINGIEYISYPSSLRSAQISKFKEELASRIEATYQKYKTDSNFSSFIRIDDGINYKQNDPNFAIIDPETYEIIHWHISNKSSIDQNILEKIYNDFRDRSKTISINRLREIILYQFNKTVD